MYFTHMNGITIRTAVHVWNHLMRIMPDHDVQITCSNLYPFRRRLVACLCIQKLEKNANIFSAKLNIENLAPIRSNGNNFHLNCENIKNNKLNVQYVHSFNA